MYEEEIKTLRSQLELDMDDVMRIEKLNLLRYYLSEKEKNEKVTKIEYNEEKDNLQYSESIRIAIILSERLNEMIMLNKDDYKLIEKLYKILQENYYYLARYLFNYFAVAMEFGIEKAKQFLAPRTCVLNYVNWELTKFYYKDRAVMTISMPQGTGKTETGKRFMAFAIGNNPNLPNMMVSYSASIAKDKFYNGIISLYADEMGNYRKIFPEVNLIYKSAETLSLDFRDDDKRTTHSEYTLYCAGFDGSITGRTRAHNILYIDDLVKDIEEASNNDIMDKKWTEFTGTLKKRMQGHCKLLLVGTIFSINDPLSRLIEYYKTKDSKRIKIIKIPGLNENMESNFNYGYGFAITTEMFLEDKDLMDAVSFECLIQQNPIDRDGLLFNEEEFRKFKEYGRDETYERTVAAVDVAWGGGDSLAMPIVDEHKNGDCPLIDVYYSKGTKEETIPQVVAKIIQHHITYVFFEANNGGDMYAEAVKEELKKKGVNDCFVDYDKAPTTKSKLDRILAQQGAIKGALVSTYRLLIKYRDAIRGNRMYNDFLNELFRFSQNLKKQGKQHDDSPDSLASLFTNVLKNENSRAGAYSHYSRKDLGI